MTRARAFIAQAQLGSDTFAAAPLVDVVEAIRAMRPSPQRDTAVVALYLALPDNAQALFARLGVLGPTPYGDLAGIHLAEERLRAGTLGLGPEHGPADPLVVLEALRFAAKGTSVVGATDRLVTILQNLQHGDGSFGFVDDDGDISLTAEVVRTLRELSLGPVAATITGRARTWLAARANALRGELPAADLALLLLAIDGADTALVQALVQEVAARQEPTGGFDGGDLRGTALAIQGLGRGLPDLRVGRPSVDLAEAVTGESLTRTVLVSNVGLTESPVTRIDFRLLAGGAVRLTGSVPVPAIAAGRAISVAIPLGVQGAPADAVLEAIVNPSAEFGEGELDQNVVAISFRIQDLPDLVITPADIAVVPTPPVIHEANRVTIRVSNAGEAMARNVAVQLFDGDPANGGALVKQIFLGAVAAGTPRTFTADYVPRSTSATRLYARADPGGTIRERSESNNAAFIDVKPENPAEFYIDLRAEGRLTVTNGVVPSSFAQGEPASITYWIGGWIRRFMNPSPYDILWPFRGVEVVVYDAAPGGASIELSRRVVYPFVRCNLGGAAPYCGDVYSELVDVALPRDAGPGTHRITIVVDPGHLVPDRDLSNNIVTLDVAITNPGSPEIFIESMVADRYSVASARPSTIHASVMNSGVVAAVGVPYSITFPMRVVQGSIPYLAPGDRFAIDQQVVFDDLKPDYPYQYAVTLRVDPEGIVSESTKSNNSASILMSQGIGDFRIDAVSQRVRPAPAGTATTPVDITVYNDTTERTAWMQVSAGGASLYDDFPLEPSGSRVVTLNVPTKGLKGAQTLTATVTAQSPASHWSGANRTFVLDVGNADFAVTGTAITLDPELPVSGQPVTASVLVSNLGDVGAETSVRLYRGYPEQGELVSSGRVYVGAGAASSFVGVPFLPRQEAPYVITAVVDEEDAWTELDERFNNRAVRNTLKTPGQIQVVFDEIHGPGSTIGDNPDNHLGGYPGNLGEFARDLIARGYDVKAIGPDAGALGPAHLRGVDVLLAFASVRVYGGSELRLLRDYVEHGGGFFYLGEHREPPGPWAWGAPEDQIASTFGFVSNHDLLNGRGIPCSVVFQGFTRAEGNVRDHVITTGVDSIIMAWGGSFGDVLPPGAEVLIRSPATWPDSPNTVVSAVFPIGEGRMGIIGDGNVFDADSTPPSNCGMGIPYYSGSNARFGHQMVDWLAKGGLRDWKPDLVFIPSRLELSKTVIDAGDLVTVLTTVRNIGGALGDAGVTTVRLYDGDPASGRLIGEQEVPALGIDQGYQVAFAWDTHGASGHHVLTAVVDPANLVDEFAEDNNQIALAVDVRRDVDLRIDPSDLVVTPGDPPQVGVRVHNIGYTAVPAGARVDLLIVQPGAATGAVLKHILAPAIPARGAVTLAGPWIGQFPAGAFDLRATVAAPGGSTDADLRTNETRRRFEPPELTLHTPLAGTRWGGLKSVRFSASSATRPKVTCGVAMGPVGGPLDGLLGSTCDAREVDTTQHANGEYLIQVTADDGLQRTLREVRVSISNDGQAVRTFGASPGTATALLAPPSGTTTILLPVGSRVTSATAVAVPVRAASRAIRAAPAWDYGGSPMARFRGALHLFTAVAGTLVTQVSYDEGASWSADLPIASGVIHKAAAVNAAGLHVVYSTAAGAWYRRSEDGSAWSAPVQISATIKPPIFALRATGERLALISPDGQAKVALANADGSGWGPFVNLGWGCDWADASVRGGKLHVLTSSSTTGTLYRSVAPDSYADPAAYSAPVQVVEPGYSGRGALFTSNEILVSRFAYLIDFSVQRCSLDRDCTNRDEWLPEPAFAAPYNMYDSNEVWFSADGAGPVRLVKTGAETSNGGPDGAVWSGGISLGGRWPSPTTVLLERDVLSIAGSESNLWRWPGFAPTDVTLDVGADGEFETAIAGMLNVPVQSDVSAAVSAYLATHADGDDGVVDARIAVPLAFAAGGAGQAQLADLEVVYTPENAVAGFAEPPVFSPTASPGVLDSSTLSLLAGSSVSLIDQAGAARRVLATTAAGGRSVAIFDGRDDAGIPLASGRYPFGTAGTTVAEVEIDDIPPTAVLRSAADGSYGGLSLIFGTASDADWAGTSKNFARYLLEFTRNGADWTRITASSSPADGVLGTWDTRQLSAGPATLRLTAWDRAGNSTSTSRVYGVSPDAPLAPVIDAPTVAGKPVDSMAAAVTVAGRAEPGATVTVFVDAVAVGTAASDGRWVLSGVQLPNGTASIAAKAERSGMISPSSQPILVTRYALTVALDLPPSASGDSPVPGAAIVARSSTFAGPVTVRLSARDATGAPADIHLSPAEQVVSLAASGSAGFPIQLGGPSVRAGTYEVRAEVVSGGKLPASAARPITLEPVRAVAATLTSDKASYSAEQIVGLQARIANPGTAPTGDLQAILHVVAPGGNTTALGPYAVASTPAGGASAVAALFGNPPLAVGTYTAEVVVLDAWSNVVATATTTFGVREGRGPLLSGQIAVNPTAYSIGSPLHATWSVSNGGPDTTADIAVVLLRATDGLVFARWDGRAAIAQSQTVSSVASLTTSSADGNEIVAVLLGNGRGLAAQTIPPGLVPDVEPPVITIDGFSAGEYRAGAVTPVVTVTDESAFTAETRLGGAPYASGTPVTEDGSYVVSVCAVDAWGNHASAQRGFTVDTVRPVITISGVVDGALANAGLTPVVQVTELHPRLHVTQLDGSPWAGEPVGSEGQHLLAVHAEDLAGNTSDAQVAFTIDRTPPVISVTRVDDGALYGAAVDPLIAVTDAHPAAPQWTASLNGQPWTGGTIADDGDWVLYVAADDAAGNVAAPVLVQFSIDTRGPIITVAGVWDGLLTRQVVVPVVSIEEPHLVSSVITLDGVAFVSGSPISAEGDHVIAVSAADAVGHTSSRSTTFSVDRTPPAIVFAGVTDGGQYASAVTPTVQVTDTHPGSVAITLDGTPFSSGAQVADPGVHVLAVTAEDAAGNTSSAQVSFAIQEGACPSPEPVSARLPVFTDSPVNCFEVLANWGNNDLQHHATVHGGSTSIAFDPSGWGAVKLGREQLRNRYVGLEFWVNGGATGGQQFAVDVLSGGDRLVRDAGIEALVGGPLPPNTWTHVKAPFRMPNQSGELHLVLKAFDGPYDTVYLDDFVLVAATAGACSGARGASCSDGNVCNGAERCDGGGVCVRGQHPTIDDQNPCTVDGCDPTAGVNHVAAPTGRSCFVGGDCRAFGACDAAGSCQPSAGIQEARVYDDAVGMCFDDGSTSTRYDPYQDLVVRDGVRAIRLEPTAWDQLRYTAWDIGGSFDAVEFWVHGGDAGGQVVHALVSSDSGELHNSYLDETLGHSISPGTWEHVRLPLTAPSVAGFLQLVFEIPESGGAVYFDDIRFVRSSP